MGIIEQLAEQRAEQRVEESKREVVQNLLKGTDFSAERIASLTATSVDFVLKLKKIASA